LIIDKERPLPALPLKGMETFPLAFKERPAGRQGARG